MLIFYMTAEDLAAADEDDDEWEDDEPWNEEDAWWMRSPGRMTRHNHRAGN